MVPDPPEARGVIVQVSQTGDWTLPQDLLEAGLRAVMAREGSNQGELSVTFLTDEEIQALNLEYLGKDHPTDVIAFALHDPGNPPLGDVYVGYSQARRQAEELGVELEEELLRLVVHGALHVMGHEHPEGEDRLGCEMFLLQEALVAGVLRDG